MEIGLDDILYGDFPFRRIDSDCLIAELTFSLSSDKYVHST